MWNAPRTFKRSFAATGGLFALLPGGGSSKAPKLLWTYGDKNMPRGSGGRFVFPWKPVRKDPSAFRSIALQRAWRGSEALATFYRVGLKELGDKVEKRMAKLIQI